MIYCIGGSPRTGKTTLSKIIADKTGADRIPTDYIGSAIGSCIPESERKERYPLGYRRQELKRSNDLFYNKYTADEIVGFYVSQAESLWAGIKTFIEYAIFEQQDLVIEGYHIQPKLIRDLVKEQKECKVIFLYKLNTNDILHGLKNSKDKTDWVLNNTKDEATYGKIASTLSSFGNHIESEATSTDLSALNMDKEFEEQLQKAVSILTDTNS